jgi:hypothetical protein
MMTIERAQEITRAMSQASGAQVGAIEALRGPDTRMGVTLELNPVQALLVGKFVTSEEEAKEWLDYTFASTLEALEQGYYHDPREILWNMFGAGFTLGLAASRKDGAV